MAQHNGPVIDMTPDGNFIEPPKPSISTILLRLALFGVALCMAAALFWTFLLVLPLLFLAGIIGYFMLKPRVSQFNIRRY